MAFQQVSARSEVIELDIPLIHHVGHDFWVWDIGLAYGIGGKSITLL